MRAAARTVPNARPESALEAAPSTAQRAPRAPRPQVPFVDDGPGGTVPVGEHRVAPVPPVHCAALTTPAAPPAGAVSAPDARALATRRGGTA